MTTTASRIGSTFSSLPFTRLPGFSTSWLAVTSQTRPTDDLFLTAPADLSACARTAAERLRQPRSWAALADIVRDSGRHYGVPESALARLDLLAAGKAVMVVTGQQVGYLGGPLYTFVKAYHTTRLAAELEERLQLPVLPLFWLEGRDHDLEEVRHASFVSSAGELQALRFAPEQEISGYEVGAYAVSAEEHIRRLAQEIGSPNDVGLDRLDRAYSGTTLADAMGRLLAATLGPRGLLIIEGMDPRLKALASPLLERILEAGPHLTELLYARAAELEAQGWNAPMAPTHDNYLFYLTRDHRRASLTYDGRLKHPDGHTETITVAELRQLIRSNPDAMSPKAALRPPYQDFILPTIAYVAGPGEMDYQAQLTPFYREFGIPAPSLFPRLSVTVTDHKLNRQLEKLSLSLEQLLSTPSPDLRKQVLRGADDGHTAALFARSREDIQAVYDRLHDQLASLDPTLAGLVQSSAGKSLHPLDHLREKTDKALKQRHAVTLSRLERALNALHPHDKLAERVLCTGHYLVKYGPDSLLSALDELPALPSEHFAITLDS